MNLTCRHVAELLIDYVDGSMPTEQRELLKRHLCGCVPCAIYLHTYQDTIRMTKSLPEAPMPKELSERLWAAMDQQAD